MEELAGWMAERFEGFGKGGIRDVGDGLEDGESNGEGKGLFERVEVPEEGKEGRLADKEVEMLVRCIREETEEGKKVGRNGGKKFVHVFRRRGDPAWPGEE